MRRVPGIHFNRLLSLLREARRQRNMEKKIITVKEREFEFFFDENSNMWRIIETPHIIQNHSIDIEVDLKNLDGEMDWNLTELFIGFIKDNILVISEGIGDAKRVLLSLFESIYKKTYEKDFLRISILNYLE